MTSGIITGAIGAVYDNRLGLAVRLESRGTSVRIRFGSPFSSKVVVCGQSCDFVLHNYETLKCLSSLHAHLNAEVILVVTV